VRGRNIGWSRAEVDRFKAVGPSHLIKMPPTVSVGHVGGQDPMGDLTSCRVRFFSEARKTR
jgi:hypothetical protein